MEVEERIAAIRARMDETIERIAEVICAGGSPDAAQRLLRALAAELAKELQKELSGFHSRGLAAP
ncbi:hypothetical protein [Bradyrhizobium sp. F1.2.6]|uniref:hypothetical protein n=1 Tax=Bradyrhizobium sp. F1.2.6 TaxID=3156354 RepID=UPI00339A46BC